MRGLLYDLLSMLRVTLLPFPSSIRFAAEHGRDRGIAAAIWLTGATLGAYVFANMRYAYPFRIPATPLLAFLAPLTILLWAWFVTQVAPSPSSRSTDMTRQLFYVHSLLFTGIILLRLPLSRIPVYGSLLSNALYLYLAFVLFILVHTITRASILRSILVTLGGSLLTATITTVASYFLNKIPDLVVLGRRPW